MGLTGDTRPRSQRRSATNSAEDGNRVKALGSWISGAAAHVTASVAQSIVAAKSPPVAGDEGRKGNERRKNSIASSISSLQRTASIRSGISTPCAPESISPSSIRTPIVNNTRSFALAKDTITSLFTSKPSSQPAPELKDDGLCTLDLAFALPSPTEGTSVKELKDIHATAMASLIRFQKAYRSRVQQVKTLQQEAELRDEELQVEKLRSRTLEARLDRMAPICKEVASHGGPVMARPPSEVDVESRRTSGTTEVGEPNGSSVFSKTGSTDTPITNTLSITSSTSSVYTSLDATPTPSTSTDACENCKGKTSSYAWVALSNVRTENQTLKEKCRELEEGINDALEQLDGRR